MFSGAITFPMMPTETWSTVKTKFACGNCIANYTTRILIFR